MQHDTTILALLGSMGLYNGTKIPYSTTVLIELYELDPRWVDSIIQECDSMIAECDSMIVKYGSIAVYCLRMSYLPGESISRLLNSYLDIYH